MQNCVLEGFLMKHRYDMDVYGLSTLRNGWLSRWRWVVEGRPVKSIVLNTKFLGLENITSWESNLPIFSRIFW